MKCFIVIAHGRYPYCEGEKQIYWVTKYIEEAKKNFKELDKKLDSDCWLLRIEEFKDKKLVL